MDTMLKLTVLLSVVLNCNGVSIREQLAHIAKLQQQFEDNRHNARRFGVKEESVILGAPSFPNHLPEAEPILPGHTLLRPAIGMLKSAVKFPHKELENGAGVYGHIKNLGIRYDGKNERVMYSGFRRMLDDIDRDETNSDSSSDEVPDLRQSYQNQNQQRNFIKRYVKVFPTETKSMKENQPTKLPKTKQNLVYYNRLPGGNINNYNKIKPIVEYPLSVGNKNSYTIAKFFTQPYDEFDSYGRSKREIKRTLDTKLHSSGQTLKFASMLLKKLQDKQQNQQNIVILQPGSDSEDNEKSSSLEEISKPMSLFGGKTNMGLTNAWLKKFANKLRRQQNIVVLRPPEEESLGYGGGVDQSLEDIALVTERPNNWFYKEQDAYNHIKINPDAPEQDEYIPKDDAEEIDDNNRNWWFYHQDDFKPFPVDDI